MMHVPAPTAESDSSLSPSVVSTGGGAAAIFACSDIVKRVGLGGAGSTFAHSSSNSFNYIEKI